MHPLDICTGYWPDADNVLICSIQFYFFFFFHLIYLCLIVFSVLQPVAQKSISECYVP